MILANNFLPILINANAMSPKICGQLFTFETHGHKFVLIDPKCVAKAFKIRWILLLFLSFSFFIRCVNLKFSDNYKNTVFETNVSIMMCIVILTISERYRIRGTFPEDFLAFLNGAMEIETKYIKGTC